MPGGFRAYCGLSSMPPYVDVARPARPLGSDGIEPAPPAKERAVIQGSRKESVGVMTCRLIVDMAAKGGPGTVGQPSARTSQAWSGPRSGPLGGDGGGGGEAAADEFL